MGVLALEFLTQQCGVQENESLVRSRGARMLVVWPPHLEGHPTLRIAASEQASLKELSGFAPPTPPLPFSPEPTPFGISTLLKLPLSRSSVIYSLLSPVSLYLPWLIWHDWFLPHPWSVYSLNPQATPLFHSPGFPSMSLTVHCQSPWLGDLLSLFTLTPYEFQPITLNAIYMQMVLKCPPQAWFLRTQYKLYIFSYYLIVLSTLPLMSSEWVSPT